MSLGAAGAIPEPIRFTEIAAWLELARIEDESEREDLIAFIRALDAEFMSWAASKMKG